MLPMQTLFMLWINDSTLQKDRVKIFARLSAFQSMEGVIIPLTAKFIIGKTGVLLLVGIRCLAVMVALCFVRESRESGDRDTNTSSIPRHRTSCAQACVALKEIWSTLTHLGQNEAVRSIFLLGFFATGTGVATQQILFPFCKARFGVQMSGFAPVVMVETLSNAVVQFLVTPRLAKLGLRRLFALGLTMGCGNCLVFGLAPSMSVLLWLLSIAGLGSVGTPAFQTLMTTFADSASRCGDPSLQSGAILSALQAMQSLFLVFMPPLYQLIFSAFVNTPLGGGRHPEVPNHPDSTWTKKAPFFCHGKLSSRLQDMALLVALSRGFPAPCLTASPVGTAIAASRLCGSWRNTTRFAGGPEWRPDVSPMLALCSPREADTAKVDVSVGPNQWSPASSSPKKRGMSEEEMKQHHQELEAKGKGVSSKKKKRGATPVSALKHGAVTDLAEVFTLSAESLVDVSAFVVDIHASKTIGKKSAIANSEDCSCNCNRGCCCSASYDGAFSYASGAGHASGCDKAIGAVFIFWQG
eukprot:symbB.v1.2.023320.t1/scaffold2124.1/size88503/2